MTSGATLAAAGSDARTTPLWSSSARGERWRLALGRAERVRRHSSGERPELELDHVDRGNPREEFRGALNLYVGKKESCSCARPTRKRDWSSASRAPLMAVVFYCGGSKLARCTSCGSKAARSCSYELRGRLAGKTCDLPVCRNCAITVGDRIMCPTHARAEGRHEPP